MVFFSFLSGAGIAEEVLFRLVCISALWKLTGRKWLAVIVVANLFGAYHLSPLSGMYLTFWQYPMSQAISSTLIGIVWGYVYVKRGLETSILSHTLLNWLPLALFLP